MVSKTLLKPASFEGVGIHSGKTVHVTVLPSHTPGLRFVRTDLDDQTVEVSPKSLDSASRYTRLLQNSVEIMTPEHLLAAFAGLGITQAIIEIDQAEVPILDGSSALFVSGLLEAGLTDTEYAPTPLVLHEAIVVSDGDKSVMGLPASKPLFSYLLTHPEAFIGSQSISVAPEDFVEQIAPARTYGFYAEYQALLARGLALGGSMDNAVVIGENGYMNDLRFPDELVRHKTLDLMGDLWILGRPVIGHIIGVKSGHALNARFVHELSRLKN